MLRHVLVAALLLTGGSIATACCWGGWGCGWGGGCYSGCGWGCGYSCYSGCGYSYGCGYGGCGYGYGGYGYGYGGHCAVQVAPVHHAAVAAPAYASTADRGRLVVSLPADATLIVDGQRTTSTSAQRTFVTPPIESGRTYYYTLTAEVNRGGVNRSVTEKVYVRPGETTQVSLSISDLGTGVAAR